MRKESSCVRFLESQREKMEQLMRVGDIVSHDPVRRTSADVEGRTRKVMQLLALRRNGKKVWTVDAACREVGIGMSTFRTKRAEILDR